MMLPSETPFSVISFSRIDESEADFMGRVRATTMVKCAQLPPWHMMDDVCYERERLVAIEQTEIYSLSDRRDKK